MTGKEVCNVSLITRKSLRSLLNLRNLTNNNMAQHIPIQSFKQKRFRTIEEGIRKDFSGRYLPKYSMKYQWDNDMSYRYRLTEKDEVFFCSRYIGKGVVVGTERGDFEVHYDTEKKEITDIYLVA